MVCLLFGGEAEGGGGVLHSGQWLDPGKSWQHHFVYIKRMKEKEERENGWGWLVGSGSNKCKRVKDTVSRVASIFLSTQLPPYITTTTGLSFRLHVILCEQPPSQTEGRSGKRKDSQSQTRTYLSVCSSPGAHCWGYNHWLTCSCGRKVGCL